MLVWPAKDSDEVAVYEINWTDRLGNDDISSASFDVTQGTIEVDSATHDGRYFSWATISGGTTGERCKVLGQIVTEDGQTLQQTATLVIKAR